MTLYARQVDGISTLSDSVWVSLVVYHVNKLQCSLGICGSIDFSRANMSPEFSLLVCGGDLPLPELR